MTKFGIEFVPKEVYWRTTYYAIQAERGGFDNLWITDHFINRNVYVTLSMILAHTNKIIVGTGVTNPYLLSPISTAGAVASLNEIGPGRTICGIGAGDLTTLQQAGVEAIKPLSAMRESINIIRSLTSGNAVQNFEGKVYKIQAANLAFKVRQKIPIYVGAQGPKMLKLAGEVGDGALINASHPQDLENAVRAVKEGALSANKPVDSVDIVAYTSFSVNKDEEKALKAATPVVSFIVAGSPDGILEKHSISLEVAKEIRESLVKGDFPGAFSKVTPEMVDSFAVCGTPDKCIEKVSTILKTGVTQFVVGSPIGGNVRKSINLITKSILPHFKN